MDPVSKVHLGTLLKYTYRANLVFFAAYGSWYVIKGSQERKAEAQVERDRNNYQNNP